MYTCMDCACGGCATRAGRSDDDDFLTAMGNWGFTFVTNLLFWSSYTDALVGFRGYRKSAYEKLAMNAPGLEWSIQVPIQARKKRLRVADVPAIVGLITELAELRERRHQ